MNYVELNSITNSFCNPEKTWKELLNAISVIYKNFRKSEIDPKELYDLIESKDVNTGVPDIASIEILTETIRRYVTEYKIPGSTTLFLEFKRHTAIYLFSIGSQEKSLEILKEILSSINEYIESSKNNLDINLICTKDCVKLNMAAIQFWLEDYDEACHILEEIITYYEATEDELYLIKMVNFISIAFTYLAWIYAKKNAMEDAEKAFLHALKVLKTVKKHSKDRLMEDQFINLNTKKLFIYGNLKIILDQLINFYSYTEQFQMCLAPLNEILKIMDKANFKYDVNIRPQNHIYYFVTICMYVLKGSSKVDFSKALHYMFNIMIIVYKHSKELETLQSIFYEKIFFLIEAVNLNRNRYLFYMDMKKNANDTKTESNDIKTELTEKEVLLKLT